jgi:hypothetical protein
MNATPQFCWYTDWTDWAYILMGWLPIRGVVVRKTIEKHFFVEIQDIMGWL